MRILSTWTTVHRIVRYLDQGTSQDMKNTIASFAVALVLGIASLSSAMAFESSSPSDPFWSDDVETTGSIGGRANTSVPSTAPAR